jgi:hypothetical protein
MFRLFIRATAWLVRALLRSRSDLVLENLALRQQLAIYVRHEVRILHTGARAPAGG